MSSNSPRPSQERANNDGPNSSTTQFASTLTSFEVAWRDKQPFLETHGYMLRPRFRPGWVPSWSPGDPDAVHAEDFHHLPPRPKLTDATRIADGKLVSIKRIKSEGDEGKIGLFFSQPSLKSNSKNHCIPILDLFKDDQDPAVSYLVMPFLRCTDDPSFEVINDIIELVDQLLEGLVFIHANGVAHRDCAYSNLMMDATALYPQGFHPVLQDFTPDASDFAQVVSRYLAARPVKYYFVDFGISTQFAPEQKDRLVVGTDGLDKDVPELSSEVPYDPFKVDIFILGNYFKQIVYQEYSNAEFLKALVESMTSHEAAARPDAKAALKQWGKIRRSIGLFQRGMPLESRTAKKAAPAESRLRCILRLTPIILKRELRYTARWLRIAST